MSDTPPKTYDHLSEFDRQVFQKLDFLKEWREARRSNPFYELEKKIMALRAAYAYKNQAMPTRVLMGFSQYDALRHLPPWQVPDEQKISGTYNIDGLEVIQVIKDDFLEVL